MERLFSLIDFSKSKFELLNKMSQLELNNIDSEEYVELLNYYRLVCETYNKKLNSISDSDKIELYEKMSSINPKIFMVMPFEKLIELDEQYILLNRIKIDLTNGDIIKIYNSNKNNNGAIINVNNGTIENFLHRMLGIKEDTEEKEESSYNSSLINSYMCYDFINAFFSVINKVYKKTDSFELKEELSILRNKLLVLSSDLEERVLMTNFIVPQHLKLVNKISIETSGMSLDEYFKTFDSFITNYIEQIFLENLKRNNRNFRIDSILIETLSLLLNDKEYIEILELELNSNLDSLIGSEQRRKNIEMLLNILIKNKVNKVNNHKTRKYTKI